LGVLSFFIFSAIDFDLISIFSKHFYVLSIVFLALPLIIGQVTRGTVRWISLGGSTIQPAELVRPFLIVFFANLMAETKLNFGGILKALSLLLLPTFLILIQPSLGVAILTVIAFMGVILSSGFNKRYFLFGIIVIIVSLPLILHFLAPYQRQRIVTFINPQEDPLGAGYNSIQAMITVGSGKILGRGLGKGVQTQLAFLPERQTDFIFASVSEEMGFLGSVLLISSLVLILWRISRYMENSSSPMARAYLSGAFFVLFAQVFINIGMNLGMIPITGLPLPLVSAGGSSFLASMILLGICQGTRKYV
jgi:rod shape determining protein RodA